MSSVFEYDCEAVRVFARRINKSGQEEQRKFSVDPNLTSFDILKTILARAFDIQGDFSIAYASPVPPGEAGCSDDDEEWLPLLSDWDLDSAIISSADPSLNLVVNERTFKTLAHLEEQERFSLPMEVAVGEASSSSPSVPAAPVASGAVDRRNKAASDFGMAGGPRRTSVPFSNLRQHLEKSLVPSLTSKLQRAVTLAEETWQTKSPHLFSLLDPNGSEDADDPDLLVEARPLTEKDIQQHLNKVGEVVSPREMRLAVYQGGVTPHVRKVVWKHLLGVYPTGRRLSGKDRVAYIKEKCDQYEDLKKTWVDMVLHGKVTDDLKCVTHMVKKDVLRTDRHLPFYAGEGNPNVTVLYNVLTTFALHHPSVGYCQGMSDLLSPLLAVLQDEGQAYLAFCALMRRLRTNFSPSGEAMSRKFEHLSQGILYYDPEFFAYLKLRSADDLLYCYRWLLLEMKREFSFEDACTALEVLWASLPPPQNSSCGDDGGVALFEHKFGQVERCPASASSSPSVRSFSKRDTTFTNVVSLRKRLSSMDAQSGGDKGNAAAWSKGGKPGSRLQHQQARDRIQSAGAAEDEAKNKSRAGKALKKSSSLVTQSRVAAAASAEAAPGKEGGGGATAAAGNPGKKVKNLNEFYKLAPGAMPTGSERLGADAADADSADRGSSTNGAGSGGRANGPVGGAAIPTSPSDSYAFDNLVSVHYDRLPPPTVFGDGNPFLMFMCLACILQHRDYIMQQQLDYQEIAMHFDRMVRRHDVNKTLKLARKMFAEYLNDDWKRERMGEAAADGHLRSKNC